MPINHEPSLIRKDKMSIEASDLDCDQFRSLIARRSIPLTKQRIAPILTEDARRSAETSLSDNVFEKINLGVDFMSANFLRDGVSRADATCRIVTGNSLGTGFLIASRGFIMTNNHVLGDIGAARNAHAEFGYEKDETTIRISLRPDSFFITSVALDYTIVACDSNQLGTIEPFELLRSPATTTRGEHVNIIQHPSGRKKEIAIRNNTVVRILDNVIKYNTDTEPGSSGSAVCNDDWQLVALHHSGRSLGGGQAENEGVRLAKIVVDLQSRLRNNDGDSEGLHELVSLVPDSSPYLGFFDVAGAYHDDKEVEIPDFMGSTNFADVGCWNIEHFNDQVSDERVSKVAKVLSRLSLDVTGLVEVQEGALDRLVDELQTLGHNMDFEYLNVRGRQDLAVLYDKTTASVKKAEDVYNTYDDQLSARTSSGKTAFPRIPLFARCEVQGRDGNPVKFMMVVLHLKAFGDAQSRQRRRLASDKLAEIVADMREKEPDMPFVILGDYNELIDNGVLDDLIDSPDLFALTADDAQDGAISYVGTRHRSLIDHIIVSKDLILGDIAGDDAAIVRLDKSISGFSKDISDHVVLAMRIVGRRETIDQPVVPPREDGNPLLSIPVGAKSLSINFE